MERLNAKDIPEQYLNRWQNSLNIIADIADVPAALIMVFEHPYLEVLVSSKTDPSNPYEVGDKEKKFGLYCETVIKKQEELEVPNALLDPEWTENPDVKLGMINYLGIPINWPNDEPFGTICILDRHEHEYSTQIRNLLKEYGKVVENYLELIYKNRQLEQQSKYIKEINSILPLCAYCRRIRNDNDEWITIEKYAKDNYDQKTSHGICNDCLKNEMNLED